jgi:integrase
MPFTIASLKSLKPKNRPYKKSDGEGLFVLVSTSGSKLWRLAYRYDGKQKTLALGSFPKTGLAEARQKRDAAKAILALGRDPGKTSLDDVAAENSFEAVAHEWFENKRGSLADSYSGRLIDRLKQDVFPVIGHRPIDEIDAPEILKVLRKVEERGVYETAKRLRQTISQVFRYAIATGRASRDPAVDLRGALKTPGRPSHHAMIEPKELPEFFVKLDQYDGEKQTALAIELIMHTMVRTKELRFTEKIEFHLDGESPYWRIPAERMKISGGGDHIVPLTPTSLSLVNELIRLSGDSQWLLPSAGGRKPISENTMLYALYRMGYHSRATVHGFRRLASTVLNESGLFEWDWIEKQLAHEPRNQVRAAYNAAQYLTHRQQMMGWWSDWLNTRKEIGELLG